jgi:hypothetical protein
MNEGRGHSVVEFTKMIFRHNLIHVGNLIPFVLIASPPTLPHLSFTHMTCKVSQILGRGSLDSISSFINFNHVRIGPRTRQSKVWVLQSKISTSLASERSEASHKAKRHLPMDFCP